MKPAKPPVPGAAPPPPPAKPGHPWHVFIDQSKIKAARATAHRLKAVRYRWDNIDVIRERDRVRKREEYAAQKKPESLPPKPDVD